MISAEPRSIAPFSTLASIGSGLRFTGALYRMNPVVCSDASRPLAKVASSEPPFFSASRSGRSISSITFAEIAPCSPSGPSPSPVMLAWATSVPARSTWA